MWSCQAPPPCTQHQVSAHLHTQPPDDGCDGVRASRRADEKEVREESEEERIWNLLKEQKLREERRQNEQKALERERRKLEKLDRERQIIKESFKTEMEKELEVSAQEMKDKSVCGDYALKKYMHITQKDQDLKKVDKVLMLWTSGLYVRV
ncbi:Oral-facial-digital syndrome 1 protein like protein [Myotis brandtii]|uniref:Oral-facial-digital syndrome 1 protein like protein n=1 Tax=Myotis brandtii TaxID=109478 RepID=S7MC29_MYOBR|nr:Oral-facial-digital syndrome 1 protein like protein [Myotis brandtii]